MRIAGKKRKKGQGEKIPMLMDKDLFVQGPFLSKGPFFLLLLRSVCGFASDACLRSMVLPPFSVM